jgi:arylsulfatase A-like enzyme
MVREAVKAGVLAGLVLAAVDLGQVAWLNPASLKAAAVVWLIGLYVGAGLLGALVLFGVAALAWRAGARERVGTLRAVLLAVGGFLLAQEAALRAFSPLSAWRPWAVVGAAVVALALVPLLARLVRRVPVALAAVGLVLLAAGAVGAAHGFVAPRDEQRSAEPVTAAATGKPNVVLVLIDTLRADHLGCYGYSRPTSPHIDAFAKEGVQFLQNFSQSSWTKPATASLLTSHYPSMHQCYLEQQKLPETEVILPQMMKRAGYQTAVFSGNPWITPDYGFDRGVDHFFSTYDERFARVTLFMNTLKRLSKLFGDNAFVYNRIKMAVQGELSTTARDDVTTSEAVKWLQTHHDKPFFLYMHYMSPHHPYDPPPPYDKFVPDRSIKPVTYYPKKSYFFFEHGDPLPQKQRDDMIARYDGDILFADHAFGDLLAELKRLHVLDDSIVVLIADHGEEFYDHQNWGHGQSIYNELINVPLVIRYPAALPAGTKIGATTMSVDVVPTLLDLIGAPPLPTAAGKSLVALAKGAASDREPEAYSELIYKYGAARGVVDDQSKLIDYTKGDEHKQELYDLGTDFHEQHDLAASQPAKLDPLDKQLAEVRSWAEKRQASAAAEVQIDDEKAKRLKALGYLN